MTKKPQADQASIDQPAETSEQDQKTPNKKPKEFGGREGLEPTRYGDWENKGIISDF